MSLRGIIGLSALLLVACREDPGAKSTSSYSEDRRATGWHYSCPSGPITSVDRLYLDDGLYHLFYSSRPEESEAVLWGHAVSTDLYSWKEWPTSRSWDSIVPTGSRSVVADPLNRSGLGSPSSPPLLSYFTYLAEGDSKGIGLAYSLDDGASWIVEKKVKLGALVPESMPWAPRVFWWNEEGRFVATVPHTDKNEIRILESEDGWDWIQKGRFSLDGLLDPNSWDRVELFRIGESGTEITWGMLVNVISNGPNGGSATAYLIGHFDGREFRRTSGVHWLDYGPDNYSGSVLWDESDSSPLYMGVMNNSLYRYRIPEGARGTVLTLPRKLQLSESGQLLRSRPVVPIDHETEDPLVIIEGNTFRFSRDTLAPVILSFKSDKKGFSLKLKSDRNEQLSLYTVTGEGAMLLDRMSSGLTSFEPEFGNKKHYIPLAGIPENEEWEVEIYLDKNSAEVFIGGGSQVVSALVFPESPYRELSFSRSNQN